MRADAKYAYAQFPRACRGGHGPEAPRPRGARPDGRRTLVGQTTGELAGVSGLIAKAALPRRQRGSTACSSGFSQTTGGPGSQGD